LLRELIYHKQTTAQTWPQGIIELLLAADQACKAARHADTGRTLTVYHALGTLMPSPSEGPPRQRGFSS